MRKIFIFIMIMMLIPSVVSADIISEINNQFNIKGYPVITNELNGISDSINQSTNEYTKRISDYINIVSGNNFSISNTSVTGVNRIFNQLPNGVKDEIIDNQYIKRIGEKTNINIGSFVNYVDMKNDGQFISFGVDGSEQLGVYNDVLLINSNKVLYELAAPIISNAANEVYIRIIQLSKFNNMTSNYELINYNNVKFITNIDIIDKIDQSKVDENSIYFAVNNNTTGFPHSTDYNISSDEIKAYLLGWQMCNIDGSIPYNGVDQKYWKSITNGQIVSILPSNFTQNYIPIRIKFEMSEPIISIVDSSELDTSTTVLICLFILLMSIFSINLVVVVLRCLIDLCNIKKLPFSNIKNM